MATGKHWEFCIADGSPMGSPWDSLETRCLGKGFEHRKRRSLKIFFRVLKVQLGNFNPNIAFSLGSVNYEIDWNSLLSRFVISLGGSSQNLCLWGFRDVRPLFGAGFSNVPLTNWDDSPSISPHTCFHTPISVADIPPRRFDRMNGPRRQGWKKNSCLDVPGSSKWLVNGL